MAESEHRTIQFIEKNGVKRATITDDLKAGDCRMPAGAYIEFRSDGTGQFDGYTWTSQSTFGDKWHQTCKVLLNDPGNNHLFLQWEGPQIYPGTNAGHLIAAFEFDAKLFGLIARVEWWGTC